MGRLKPPNPVQTPTALIQRFFTAAQERDIGITIRRLRKINPSVHNLLVGRQERNDGTLAELPRQFVPDAVKKWRRIKSIEFLWSRIRFAEGKRRLVRWTITESMHYQASTHVQGAQFGGACF